jgi:hypothetical protein
VNRPEIPLILQAVRDCDKWIAALKRHEEPPNIGALGPFVRLGLALKFARRIRGGTERIEELHRLSLVSDFDQLTNKAFELEVAFFFEQTYGPDGIAFGPLGEKPDLWLGSQLRCLPVECKVVSGGVKRSRRCIDAWKRFIIWCVKEMKRRGVSAGLCVRAFDNFDADALESLRPLAEGVLAELTPAPTESWALRSAESGEFLVYGVKLSDWGMPRPPLDMTLGLDGDLSVWVQYDPENNHLTNSYFFALKFQTPTSKLDAILANFKVAAKQLAVTHPQGPGLAVLKVSGLRMGDLFEADRSIREALSTRPQVSVVLLLRDETGFLDAQAAEDRMRTWGFTLKPYVIVNECATRPLGWHDSRAEFFPTSPISVLRSETGELVPFDFDEERRLLESGTVLTGAGDGGALLLHNKEGSLPRFPHLIPEGPEISELEGRMTFYFAFDGQLASTLFPLDFDKVVLEWFVVGKTQFQIYRDRDLNLRVNRRSPEYQDNVAIDLVAFGRSDKLLLQLVWCADNVRASLRCSDDYPPAVCRSARSPLD